MELPAGNRTLPTGYRFHPTDIELFVHYLKRKVLGKPLEPEAVIEIDIYQYHPEDLRGRACKNSDLNLYFFCPRGKKYGNGDRTNRTTKTGHWKSTGKDKVVLYRERTVGRVKHLVFHEGKPQKGTRTDWVMHEYKLEDSELATEGIPQDAYVLCKIFKKDGLGPRNRQQFGSLYNEEDWDKEDELTNNVPMVPVADQDQAISIDDSICAHMFPLHTLEQVMLPALVSISDQAPAPAADGSNVASTSNVVVSNSVDAEDQGPFPTSYDNWDFKQAMLDRFSADEDAYGNLGDLDDFNLHWAHLFAP